MSTAHVREKIPVRTGVALLAILIVSYVYALMTFQVTAWISAVVWLLSLGLSLFVIYLFYRFVVAVERIADKL